MQSVKTSVFKNTHQEADTAGHSKRLGRETCEPQQEAASFSLLQNTAAFAGTCKCGHYPVDSGSRILLSKRWTLPGELNREFKSLQDAEKPEAATCISGTAAKLASLQAFLSSVQVVAVRVLSQEKRWRALQNIRGRFF